MHTKMHTSYLHPYMSMKICNFQKAQNKGRVTYPNMLSGLMPMGEMLARNKGKNCGKQDGDYLSWGNTPWSLQRAAMWTKVSVLCRQECSTQLFTTQVV